MTTTRSAAVGRDTGAPLSSWGAVNLVAGREVRTRLTSKAFLLTTALLVVAVVLGGVLLNLASSSDSTLRVGLVPDTASLAPSVTAVAEASGGDVETTDVADAATGEQQLRDGDIDALVTSSGSGSGSGSDFTVVVDRQLDPALQAVFSALARQIALVDQVSQLGGDPETVANAVNGATPTVTTLEPEEERDSAQIVAGFVAGILIFISLMTCGQLVAQGVVEEKTSRVVELLLAAIKPWQLMAGKVLGIGLIGLFQVALVVGAGAGTAMALGLVDSSSIDLGAAAAWALVWFVVGFVMYALALGALAALVSRQEDVGSVTSPVITLMMIPYILGVSIAPWAPDNPLVVWLSYVPFCSPLLMPMRIALGTAEMWEVLVALGLSLALIPALVWLAGRIYSNAILRTGTRVKLRDALRAG